jgi:hypothetical protein
MLFMTSPAASVRDIYFFVSTLLEAGKNLPFHMCVRLVKKRGEQRAQGDLTREHKPDRISKKLEKTSHVTHDSLSALPLYLHSRAEPLKRSILPFILRISYLLPFNYFFLANTSV